METITSFLPANKQLTEEQIEMYVERAVDKLDRKLFKGSVSMEEYYKQFDAITAWAKQQETILN